VTEPGPLPLGLASSAEPLVLPPLNNQPSTPRLQRAPELSHQEAPQLQSEPASDQASARQTTATVSPTVAREASFLVMVPSPQPLFGIRL